MSKKHKEKKELIDSVPKSGGTAVWESDVIPTGKTFRLKVFGCYDPPVGDGTGSIVHLEYGEGATWETIRVIGYGTHNHEVNQEYVGDGVKKFRITRTNNSSKDKIIYTWFEGFQVD